METQMAGTDNDDLWQQRAGSSRNNKVCLFSLLFLIGSRGGWNSPPHLKHITAPDRNE
jgi:hypothetical protein